jgi:hypothetical protein
MIQENDEQTRVIAEASIVAKLDFPAADVAKLSDVALATIILHLAGYIVLPGDDVSLLTLH